MEKKADCLMSVNKHVTAIMNYIQRFFPITVSERSEEGKLFQGQQEKVSGLSRKLLVLARISEKFRSTHSFIKIIKKDIILLGKKVRSGSICISQSLLKMWMLWKVNISEMKNIRVQEKKLEEMWKKKLQGQGKYNLEVYITLQLSRQ